MCAHARHRLAGLLLSLGLMILASPTTALAAPPGNDDFSNATSISGLPFSDTVSNTEATRELGEPECNAFSRTVWYSFTPSTAQVVRVDTSGSSFFDTGLAVYQAFGAGFGGLAFVPGGCSAFGGSIIFSAQAGTTYYVQAGDLFSGGGDLRINLQAVPSPPNDDFEAATVITALPFDETLDATAATVEAGEPHDSACIGPPTATAWYAFTPSATGSLTANLDGFFTSLAVFSGASLSSLTSHGCRNFGQLLTFRVDAGTTYYFQVVPLSPIGQGVLSFHVRETPPPVVSFFVNPPDPSTFDTVQFTDNTFDPVGIGIESEVWDLGDGTTATGCCPSHRYATDGDYTVQLTVTTFDGRIDSTSRVVQVRTHDVAITAFDVPKAGRVNRTERISVAVGNGRYPETVQVQFLKGIAGGGFETVGTLTQFVPAHGKKHPTPFAFSYTFTDDDATVGKVTFKAIATIVGARDALPADNEAIASVTRVRR